jgi:hypothetical protein
VLLASGGAAALGGLVLSLSDPGREDGITQIPARTLELAHGLNESWGLHSGTSAPGWEDLLGASYGSRDAYSDLAAELGLDDLAAPQPGYDGYPDVSGLARELGLR